MDNRKIRVVADSSADIKVLDGVDFLTAPLKIITADKEYVDDAALDVLSMVKDLQGYKGKSSTSCPNVSDWLDAFGDADEVYCVTITSSLSGSYNAAINAKKEYESADGAKHVYVLDSLSTGPEMHLALMKIRDLILAGKSFGEICAEVDNYVKRTGLLFMLESMNNLANNGRVKPIAAKMAGLLGIRVVGKASDEGTLEPLSKCRGQKKAIDNLTEQLDKLGYRGGKLLIAHCFNESAVAELVERVKSKFAAADIGICTCGGLCSFYAELGGMLVGFEKA